MKFSIATAFLVLPAAALRLIDANPLALAEVDAAPLELAEVETAPVACPCGGDCDYADPDTCACPSKKICEMPGGSPTISCCDACQNSLIKQLIT